MMIRGKIVCRHKPIFCWKTNFVEQYPGIQLFAYPIKGSIANSPTVYESIFILQVLEDKYKQNFDRAVEECIDNSPLTKGEFRKIEDLSIKEHKLILSIYKFKAVHENKGSSRSASLLFALYDQESRPHESEEIDWVHVQNIEGKGIEIIFPRYPSNSVFRQNVKGIEAIREKSKKPFEIKFPNKSAQYEKDYVKDYLDYKEPVEYLLPKKIKERIKREIKNQAIPRSKIMENLQKCGAKVRTIIMFIWNLIPESKSEK